MSVKSNAPRRGFHGHGLQHQSSPRLSPSPFAAILTKLAKHLALIACLMIVGQASGRLNLGEVTIFLIVAASVALHSFARAIDRRLPINVCCPASMPNKTAAQAAQKDLRGEARSARCSCLSEHEHEKRARFPRGG
jgi:hypothetical protein